ncbi:MAG TPA: PAS domain-containing protein, partial [Candidatus Obscuribacter sp.]|nr:PAS domain-containing protein [Candidatus Obscuribacter sp.]
MLDFNARLKKLLNGAIWNTLESCQPELNQELGAALDELIILAESEHEALNKLEQQFAIFIKLVEMCPSFLWIADSDGMVEYASERWMEFSGATEEQTLGTGWMDFVDERDRESAV